MTRAAVAGGLVVAAVAGIALGTGREDDRRPPSAAKQPQPQLAAKPRPKDPAAKARRRPPPRMRGVHVTMRLASDPRKLDEYLSFRGLNAIEIDAKDEGGLVGFVPRAVPLARAIGAAKLYYKPALVAERVHRRGVYLIGRVVTFQDPVLAAERPALAVRRPDGSLWATDGGREWVNPYDRRVWD